MSPQTSLTLRTADELAITAAQRRRRAGRATLAAFAVGTLLAACSGTTGGQGSDGSASGGGSSAAGSGAGQGGSACADPVRLRVSVAPAVRDVVQAQAQAVSGQTCAAYDVVGEEAGTVAARGPLAPGTEGAPDLWIPDSPLWPLQVNQRKSGSYTVSPDAIATSPVTLAVPKALVAAGKVPTGQVPMAQQIAGAAPTMAVASPKASTATMIILLTAWRNSGDNLTAKILAGTTFLKVANSTATDDQLFQRAVPGSPQGPVVFPASEQGMHDFNTAHPDAPLTSLGAVEGLAALKYVGAVPAGLDAAKTKAADALLARLRTPEAADALRAEGLRVEGRGSASVPGLPADVPISMDSPTPELLAQVQQTVGRLSAKVRMLLVVDTSGSMLEPSGYGVSRIELAGKSVATSLSFIPPNTEGGLWQMANNLTFGAHDWRQVTPIQPLTGPDGALLPGALALSNGFDAILPTVRGGTGLYDTTWDAYRAVQKVATKDANNLVVLMTDGRNEDDPGSITLQRLVADLKGARSADKPVRIVLAGLGPKSDMAALRAIAAASGGRAHLVDTRTTLIDVIVGSLVS